MTLDLSKYLVSEDEGVEEPLQKSEPLNLERFLSPESETGMQARRRHVARTASRVGETLAGLPGDVVQFIKKLGAKLPEASDFLKREPSFIQSQGKKLLEKLPTSQKLKEFSEKKTGGYTAPKSEGEAFSDEIASLTTALATPAKDPTKFTTFLKALGKATAAKSSGKVAEKYGAGPVGQTAAELGTLFLTGFLGKKTANKFVSDQFQEARSKIPEGTMLNTSSLSNQLNKIERELAKGISTPTKKEVMNAIQELNAKASTGAMPAEEIVEAYHNINERLNTKKLFDELTKSERKILKHRYDLFKDQVNETIKDYGKHNPEFFNQWKDANQAYATIAKSKQVSNFLQSHLGSMPKHLATSVALEIFFGFPKVAAATTGGAAAVKTGELLYRIAKSPNLQKHYLDVINASLSESLPAVIRGLNALDKELKEEK